MVEALIKRGDLDEADACDLDRVGEAIAAAARECQPTTDIGLNRQPFLCKTERQV